MGVVVTKLQHHKEDNMEGRKKSALSSDKKKKKSSHGSDQKTTKVPKQGHAKRQDDMSLQGARMTLEEPKMPQSDGKHDACKSLHVTGFDEDDVPELERYFKKRYSSDIKKVKRVGWNEVIIEFKSTQVAKQASNEHHVVRKKTLKLTLDSVMKTEQRKITNNHDKRENIPATPKVKDPKHLYPMDQLKAIKNAPEKENDISKHKPNERHELQKHGHGLQETVPSDKETALLPCTNNQVTDKEDLRSEDVQFAEQRKESANGNKLDAVKTLSQEDDQVSRDRPNQSVPERKLQSHDYDLKETTSSKVTRHVLPGMDNYSSDEDDKCSNDALLVEAQEESTKATNIDTNGQSTSESVDERKIQLDTVKLEFIKKVYSEEYDGICRENNVVISQETGPQSCKFIFRTNESGKGDVGRACDKLLELYRGISAKLSRNNTINVLEEIPDCTIRSLAIALIQANADERVLVKNCLSDDFKVVFYGFEHDVAIARENFIKTSGNHNNEQFSEENTGSHVDVVDSQTYVTLDHVSVPVPSDSGSDTHFERTIGDITVRVYEGDLTKEIVDVVVNAANKKLEHGGGVAFAISRAGGRKIQDESREYLKRNGKLTIGQAMHTTAGDMPSKYVVHTVGPKWDSHGDKETVKAELFEAMNNVLHYASSQLRATSIAIPAISAGIYGVPVEVCAEQLMSATLKFVHSPPGNNTLRDIRFVNIDNQINRAFVQVFGRSLSSIPSRASKHDATDGKECPICMDKFVRPKRLYCCNNVFCTDCIDQAFQHKPVCPTCGHQHGVLKGTQPTGGKMKVSESPQSLPGYPGCGSIQIQYTIPDGYQEDCHPNPGRPYEGTRRVAFLPNNREGRDVLQLLRKAFDNRLVFTVGTSVTTGETDVVTWNDIHHKTNPHGGASNYGYPDPDYLKRVKEELAAKGIR